MNKSFFCFIAVGFFLSFCGGCANSTSALLDGESQVKLRSMQSRKFDTNDKEKALRVAMATLQDLGFVIDEADNTLGTVSATKLHSRPIENQNMRVLLK